MRFSNSFLILGLMFAFPVQALPTVEKGSLSTILPNIQILFDGQENLPIAVRVVSIAGDGECQEPGDKCEQNALYVVLSDDEKLPVKSVTYNLGKAHEWVLQVVTRCAGPKDDLCAKIVLDQALTDTANKTWKIVHHVYEFRIDSVKEIEK